MSDPASPLDHAAGDLLRELARLGGELVETAPAQAALTHLFAARERLVQVQEATLAALNLPTAADAERITRRVRSVAQRIDGVEESLDRIEQHVRGASRGSELVAITAQLEALRRRLDELAPPVAAAADADGGARA